MKPSFKWLFRQVLQLILSVYILSIPWQNKTLFEHAKTVLVDNRFFHLLSSHCTSFYDQATDRLRLSILESGPQKKNLP